MNISYVTRLKKRLLITGAHIYDNQLINIIDKNTEHTTKELSINIKKWDNNLILAPFLYMGKILKEKGTDVFLFNSISFMRFMFLPYVIKFYKRKKSIAVHHHFMHRQLKGIKRKIYGFLEWNFLKNMDKIIVASPYVYDDLLKKFPKEKLMFFQIPFENQPLFESLPIKGNLTYTGTIEYRKGLTFLIQALIKLKSKGKEYPLIIIGQPHEQKYFDQLKQDIIKNNLNVTFTGFLSKEGKERILSRTDVFVFPSLLEGYGMAIVEAQTYGLPIVSFDNSAMPYNVKNGINGYAVATEDVDLFADAIEKIIEDRELRNKLSIGAFENAAKQNTFEQFEKDIIDNFSSINN